MFPSLRPLGSPWDDCSGLVAETSFVYWSGKQHFSFTKLYHFLLERLFLSLESYLEWFSSYFFTWTVSFNPSSFILNFSWVRRNSLFTWLKRLILSLSSFLYLAPLFSVHIISVYLYNMYQFSYFYLGSCAELMLASFSKSPVISTVPYL